jgi:hypothetical protein
MHREGQLMAYAYHVYLVDPTEDYIPVEHIFYGRTKQECTDRFMAHQAVCKSFGPAVAEGRFDDLWEQIEASALPRVEEEDDDEDDDEEVIDVDPE